MCKLEGSNGSFLYPLRPALVYFEGRQGHLESYHYLHLPDLQRTVRLPLGTERDLKSLF